MPLPQKVVERLAREPAKTPGWSGRLLMFSSIIFIISLGVYLGLTFGYEPYLNYRIGKLDDEIKSFNEQIPIDEQQKIIVFYSQLRNLKDLLSNRHLISPVMSWLEKNTQASVYYTSLDFNTANNRLALSGVARTIADFNQEFQILENNPQVQNISLNSLATDQSGLWKFDLTAFLTGNPGQQQ